MPIIDIVVRNIDTQMFDVVLDENTYKQLTFEPGVYCVYHKMAVDFVPLYVGSSMRLSNRASRFFVGGSQTNNEYLTAVLKYLGTKKIVLAIKKFNVSTREDLLLRECEYQRKIRPLLNHKFSLDMLTWGIKNQNRMSD